MFCIKGCGCFEIVVGFLSVPQQQPRWMLGAVSVSDVINFHSEQVITPSSILLRSSHPPRVYDDYYFHVGGCRAERCAWWQIVSLMFPHSALLCLLYVFWCFCWLRDYAEKYDVEAGFERFSFYIARSRGFSIRLNACLRNHTAP
jgi:hypothetical protein